MRSAEDWRVSLLECLIVGHDWPSGGNGVVRCPGALPSTTNCTFPVRAAVSGHVLLHCPPPGPADSIR